MIFIHCGEMGCKGKFQGTRQMEYINFVQFGFLIFYFLSLCGGTIQYCTSNLSWGGKKMCLAKNISYTAFSLIFPRGRLGRGGLMFLLPPPPLLLLQSGISGLSFESPFLSPLKLFCTWSCCFSASGPFS